MKNKKSIPIAIVCFVLGLTLTWQFKSMDFNQTLARDQNKRADELKDELIMERKNNDDLRKRNDELVKISKEYENAHGEASETKKILDKELERARIIAGLTDVKGKGIIVTIDNTALTYVYESDLLGLINELKASDAQAISINDERIVATSEIREAGERYIMVNGKQLIAPYVIKVIADPEKIENALKMVGGQLQNMQDFQLKVNVQKPDAPIVIPKVKDDGSVIKTDLLIPVK